MTPGRDTKCPKSGNIVNKVDKEISEVKDLICGMKVNLEKTKFKSTYEGKEYGFCSASC